MDKIGNTAGGTRIERTLFGVMRRAGLTDLRCEATDLPGTPDVVSDKMRLACFAHGCFWHHHDNCELARLPAKNTAFWAAKFERNKIRDRRAVEALRARGWTVVTIWECACTLGKARDLQECVDRALMPGSMTTEITVRADGTRQCVIQGE